MLFRSVKASVGAKGSLEVDSRASFNELEVCARPGLAQQIEAENFPRPARGDFHNGETTAIDSNAITESRAASDGRREDVQLDPRRGFADSVDGAGFFNNACEHGLGAREKFYNFAADDGGATRAVNSKSGPS